LTVESPIEWVFTVGNEQTLAAYPGNLGKALAAMSDRLRSYADGRLPESGLAKGAQPFIEQSVKTSNWIGMSCAKSPTTLDRTASSTTPS